jgi:hypothetical protein
MWTMISKILHLFDITSKEENPTPFSEREFEDRTVSYVFR